jgi:hypothetical protein
VIHDGIRTDLIQADPSIYSVPQPTEHTQDLLARL